MGYMHIDNLYKNTDVLLLKEVYALEKIHGTSAHLGLSKANQPVFSSGGCKHDSFVALFSDPDALFAKLRESFPEGNVIIYGEAYGGKCQGMSKTYGPTLRFVAFEVRAGERWLDVPSAESVSSSVGIEFVPYRRGPATVEWLDAQRDMPSEQAVRNGITEPRPREGIVIRPVMELRKNNGERIIAKHKSEAFKETKTHREVSTDTLAVLTEARAIADEWVTPMRLTHVLDAFPGADERSTGDVIRAMLADIEREASGEIVLSKDARKAIGRATGSLFRDRLAITLRAGVVQQL